MDFLTRMTRKSPLMVQNMGNRAPLTFCHNAVGRCVIICFLSFNSSPKYALWLSVSTTTATTTTTSVSVDTHATAPICRVDPTTSKSRLGAG